jgi:hypothetical protein
MGKMMTKVRYSLTPADYRDYQKAYLGTIADFWGRNHFRISVGFGSIVFIGGLNWVFNVNREKYPGLVAIAAGLYLIFVGIWGRMSFRRWFRKNEHLFQNLEGEFSEEGVTVRTAKEETRTKWEHYTGFVETPTLLLLRTPEGSCVLIPKRAFAPAELDSVLQLIRNKVALIGR